MKAALLFIALGVALVVSVSIVSLRQSPVTVGCDRTCQQDIATAVYYSWNQLDCDSPDAVSSTCNDELNSVNVGPKLTEVRVDSKYQVHVSLEVNIVGGGWQNYSYVYDADGLLVKSK